MTALDQSSMSDAMLGRLGHPWSNRPPWISAGWDLQPGALLLIASILALLISNSTLKHTFDEILELELGLVVWRHVLQDVDVALDQRRFC